MAAAKTRGSGVTKMTMKVPHHAAIWTRGLDSRRSRWKCELRCGSGVVRLLGLRVRIPPGYGWLSLVNIVARQRSLWQADPSCRRVLPSVYVSLRVIRCNN